MRSITTIIRGLYNKPALVSEEYANNVFTALENKDLTFFGKDLVGKGELQDKDITVTELSEHITSGSNAPTTETAPKKAVLLEIEGALTHKRQLSHSGMSSYQGMKIAFKSLLSDPSITHWVMDMSSQGGMAYQCFETARYIRKLADDNDITLIAYVNEQASSAGYALTAVAHEVISNPMSSIGSIGVVVTLRNDLPKELAEGKERIFITYGSEKRPFTAEGNIKKEKLEEIQAEVDVLGKDFDKHVATYREELSEADVKKLGARSFSADKALELGLIDKIMEREDFLSYVSSLLVAPTTTTSKESENLSGNNDTLAELEAKLSVLEANNEKLEANLKAVTDTNSTLSSQNEKMTEFMTKLADDQATAKKTKLVATLSEFSFVEDSEKMATVLLSVDTEGKDLILASFNSAAVASKEALSKANEDKSNADLFSLTSTGVNSELADMGDFSAEVDKILENKHGGKG